MDCKKCQSTEYVKQGIVNGKQRYKCKKCGCCFREGDNRTSAALAIKKSMSIILYSNGNMSIRGIARILDAWEFTIRRWLKREGIVIIDPSTNRIIAMVTGNRDIVTMKKLYAQLEKFTNAVFHTDDWNAILDRTLYK
jgi:transposase-like protein